MSMGRQMWVLMALPVVAVLWPFNAVPAWWELLLLVLTLAAIAWAFTHDRRCPACRAVKEFLKGRHPDWRLEATSHRAFEHERTVVAVFYQPAKLLITPTPYQLVSVNRDMTSFEELPSTPGSPYALWNRK